MRKCLSLVYNLLNCLHFGPLCLSHRRSFGNPPRVSEARPAIAKTSFGNPSGVSEARLAIAKTKRGLALSSETLSVAVSPPLPPPISGISSRGCLFYGLRYIERAISQLRRDKMGARTPQRHEDSRNQQGYQRQARSYMCDLAFPVCGEPSCTEAVTESNVKMPVAVISDFEWSSLWTAMFVASAFLWQSPSCL